MSTTRSSDSTLAAIPSPSAVKAPTLDKFLTRIPVVACITVGHGGTRGSIPDEIESPMITKWSLGIPEINGRLRCCSSNPERTISIAASNAVARRWVLRPTDRFVATYHNRNVAPKTTSTVHGNGGGGNMEINTRRQCPELRKRQDQHCARGTGGYVANRVKCVTRLTAAPAI